MGCKGCGMWDVRLWLNLFLPPRTIQPRQTNSSSTAYSNQPYKKNGFVLRIMIASVNSSIHVGTNTNVYVAQEHTGSKMFL